MICIKGIRFFQGVYIRTTQPLADPIMGSVSGIMDADEALGGNKWSKMPFQEVGLVIDADSGNYPITSMWRLITGICIYVYTYIFS